jgi:hypothetical protein
MAQVPAPRHFVRSRGSGAMLRTGMPPRPRGALPLRLPRVQVQTNNTNVPELLIAAAYGKNEPISPLFLAERLQRIDLS